MPSIRVWDLPTRVFHWALVFCVVGLVITGNIGGNAMVWHFRMGYTVGALVLFRLLWGFWGGYWSRFSHFPVGLQTLIAYLRGRAAPIVEVGHNPLGSLSVFAMLAVLAAQVSTGLMSDDEIAFQGPLTRFVSETTVSAATHYHTEVGKLLLIALVCLHVGAVIYHQRVKRHPLVQAMIRGDKPVDPALQPLAAADGVAQRLLALALFGICAGFMAWVAALGR